MRDNSEANVTLAYYEHACQGGGVLPIPHPGMCKSCMGGLGAMAQAGHVLPVGDEIVDYSYGLRAVGVAREQRRARKMDIAALVSEAFSTVRLVRSFSTHA